MIEGPRGNFEDRLRVSADTAVDLPAQADQMTARAGDSSVGCQEKRVEIEQVDWRVWPGWVLPAESLPSGMPDSEPVFRLAVGCISIAWNRMGRRLHSFVILILSGG